MATNDSKKEQNKDLQTLYQKVYAGGSQNFYTFSSTEESEGVVASGQELWEGRRVLEVGCGEGNLACRLAMLGASVCAVDFAESAIAICREKFNLENLEFRCCSYEDIDEVFDLVVMQGVLEHMDDPLSVLKKLKQDNLKSDGCLITSSPSFLNPRGYVWMALVKLFNVPMSLSDLHFLCPFDFEAFAKELGATLTYTSTNQDWGHGDKLIFDFRKRLVNALKDADMDNSGVDAFLEWLSQTTSFTTYDDFTGANVVYRLQF